MERHPDANRAFFEGLSSVFRQWTTIELAIYHQWGGPNTQQKVDNLKNEVANMFLSPTKIYKDDLQILFESFLEVEMNIICEDGSPDELAELLVTMWRECGEGNFALVTNALAREYTRHDVLTKSQGLETGDCIDEEEDEGDEMETDDGPSVPHEPVLPIIDEDGFETVVRGRNKGRRG